MRFPRFILRGLEDAPLDVPELYDRPLPRIGELVRYHEGYAGRRALVSRRVIDMVRQYQTDGLSVTVVLGPPEHVS